MNGVRRLFSSASTTTPSPTSSTTTTTIEPSTPPTAQSVSILKQRLVQSPEAISPPPRDAPKHTILRGQPKQNNGPQRPNSTSFSPPSVRDELLMGLLASEAIIECNGFQILSVGELQGLKQEQRQLTQRLDAVSKKLKLETKIRDAALSLSKVKSRKGSNVSTGEVDSANRRVETVQKDLFQITTRSSEVNRKLLEHNAGILSATLNSLTPKAVDTSANNSGTNSPTSTSSSAIRANSLVRFSPANFYAGHSSAASPPSVKAIEKQLKDMANTLELAKKTESDLIRELRHLELEKQEQETTLTMELQAAEERMSSVRGEASRVAGLEGQVAQLVEERENSQAALRDLEESLQQRLHRITDLETQLEALSGEGTASSAQLVQERNARAAEQEKQLAERRTLESRLVQERNAWENEKHELELSRAEEVVRLEGELSDRNSDLEEAVDALTSILAGQEISQPRQATTVVELCEALGRYLEGLKNQFQEMKHTRESLTEEVQSGDAALQTANQTIDSLNQDNAILRQQLLEVEAQVKAKSGSITNSNFLQDGGGSMDKNVLFQLKALWNILPSPEARALKTGGRSPTKSSASPLASPSTPGPSLSELDVRALRALYDPKASNMPATPAGDFMIESFVKRIQALVADDRALIERLIRFAQSHDLLKTNAERAQRLAKESSQALETYQKQVKVLQERNDNLDSLQGSLNQQLAEMHDALDSSKAELRRMEERIHEQSEQVVSLMEANNALSAKTLSLAAEPEAVRVRLEAQLSELRQRLKKSAEDVEAMQESEQMQRVALLDELNSMQTENSQLREQLRAERAKR